jgi:AraC-like DNA-binding protein
MKEIFKRYSIGHFINEPDNPAEFAITRFDEMEEPNVDEIHKHTFYEIVWTEKGKSKQTIDYNQYEVSPHTLFFISPNQVHYFEEWKPLTGGTILFTEDFFLLNHSSKDKLFELTFLDNIYTNPCVPFSKNNFAEIRHTIDLMYIEQNRGDKSIAIIQSLLHILLTQVQRYVNSHANGTISKKYLLLYKEFKNLLDAHFHENQTTVFYANQLYITQHHLNMVSKSVTGRTASEIIKARSILEAKRFLTFTDKTITQIATDLSFFDSSYFAKIFKADTGMTPNDFKKEMSLKYRIR